MRKAIGTVRVRQHVNPLGLVFEEYRGERPVVPSDREVELEIGCADAQFLFERAARDPGRQYFGVEIRAAVVDWVNAEAAARGAPVHALSCNANNHLAALFPARSVTRVFLNFPDPWFKKRHHKRRMIDDGLLRAIAGILAPGGELFFQSDVWDVALDTLALAEDLDALYQNRAGAWSFWKRGNPYDAQSARELRCLGEERPIWRLWYTRVPVQPTKKTV